jgi:hypothetical protein
MMEVKIYDYANNAVEVKLPNKAIESIFVTIVSGDEIATFNFADGTSLICDSSSSRNMDFYDGNYMVCRSKIKEWIDFKPTHGETASYERAGMEWK